jgi:hypothetical protein
MTTPYITTIRNRPSNKNQNYYEVVYSHGITTLLPKDDETVLNWLEEGNTPEPADTPE